MQRSFTLVAAVAALFAGTGGPAQAQIIVGPAVSAPASSVITMASVMAGSGFGVLADTPGFPLTIMRRGHYVLAENLNVPGGLSGIVIAVSGVTLDLGGHSIATAATCSRLDATGTVYCEGPLGQVGVAIREGSTVVRNGRISGFDRGVQYKVADHLENLLVEKNVNGVFSDPHVGAPTLITGVRVSLSREAGFYGYNALVRGSSAGYNGYHGFVLGNSMVLDSMASKNTGAGFEAMLGSTLAVGRSMGLNNKQGDFLDVVSLGQNIRTGGNVH
jgi:hypothetical protein